MTAPHGSSTRRPKNQHGLTTSGSSSSYCRKLRLLLGASSFRAITLQRQHGSCTRTGAPPLASLRVDGTPRCLVLGFNGASGRATKTGGTYSGRRRTTYRYSFPVRSATARCLNGWVCHQRIPGLPSYRIGDGGQACHHHGSRRSARDRSPDRPSPAGASPREGLRPDNRLVRQRRAPDRPPAPRPGIRYGFGGGRLSRLRRVVARAVGGPDGWRRAVTASAGRTPCPTAVCVEVGCKVGEGTTTVRLRATENQFPAPAAAEHQGQSLGLFAAG